MFDNKIDNIKTLILSSLFIVSFLLILIKISPHAFIIFNSIPLLMIGLILRLKYIFYVFLLSGIVLTFVVSSFFLHSDKNIIFQILILFFGVFSVSFTLLFFIKNNSQRFFKTTGMIISNFIFLISFFFLIFFYNGVTEINLETFILEIKETYDLKFAKENIYSNIQIDKLIDIFISILPSIYISSIFFITISNLKISENILLTFNFKNIKKLSFNNFQVPNWFFIALTLFFLLSMSLNGFFQVLFINLSIIFSSVFVLSGIISILELLKKYNINLYVKIIILFLLFIFFSYVLLLVFFILGLSKHLKKIFNNNWFTGES